MDQEDPHHNFSHSEDDGDPETSRQARGGPSHANSWAFSGDHDDAGEVHEPEDGSAFPTDHDEEPHGADEEPDGPEHIDAGAAAPPGHQNEPPNTRQGGQPYSSETVLNNFCYPMRNLTIYNRVVL